MTNPYDCPAWCTTDHALEEQARRDADDARVHMREIGQVYGSANRSTATVTVDQSMNLDDGERSPVLVSVLGEAEGLAPTEARQLVQFILDAIEIIES